MKRKSKTQLERERLEKIRMRNERERIRLQEAQEKAAKDAQRSFEAQRRAWIRKERSKPRIEISAQYGESIYVHKRVYEAFMKQVGKKIEMTSMKVVGGSGGTLVMEYTNRHGSSGKLELVDLGPMPTL